VDPTPGEISIAAGRNIELNGNAQPTAVRTIGNVSLSAGGAIGEAVNGFIVAGSLNTTTGGHSNLGGANRLAAFNATSGGDVLLNNTGVLNVTGLSARGDAALNNVGNVTVGGAWNATGTSTIAVGSDIGINSSMTSAQVVVQANQGNITEGPLGAIIADSLTTTSSGSTSLMGANHVTP